MSKSSEYVSSGFDVDSQKMPRRQRDFVSKEPDRDGNILVTMTDGCSTHTFIVTSEAIRKYYESNPIHGRYVISEVVKTLHKAVVSFSCEVINEQLILTDNRCETIRGLYWKRFDGYDEKMWYFNIESDGTNAIGIHHGDRVRYTAFMEAFRRACIDATRGGYYEWLYKAICYPAA